MQENQSNISINSNDSTQRADERLKQLCAQVTLSQKDMESIFTKSAQQVFFQTMTDLQNDRPDEALVYLLEAEKILQRAGEKGMDVEKRLIVLTLHNLACAYQRNWELDVCANYLEALIYNFNLIIKSIETAPSSIQSQLTARQSLPVFPKQLSPKTAEMMLSIELKQRLGRYYLQFCAVNSQIRNHSGALIAARKSIQSMKRTFNQLGVILRQQAPSQYIRQQFEQKLRLIQQVSRINDNINISQYEMILQTTRHYLRKWQNIEEKEMVMSEISTEIEARFRDFSIGSIAQMSPVGYGQLFTATKSSKNDMFRTESMIEKVLVLIIGYFTISTQLRLLVQSKNPISQVSQPGVSIQLPNGHQCQTRQAEIFHLFSILLASIFIPFQMLYMKHILLSFKNHYGVDLFDDKVQVNESSKIYDEFLFIISEIRTGSMRVAENYSDIKISQINLGKHKTKNLLSNKEPIKKFSHIISDINQNPPNPKSKTKINKKTKSKSKTKKSTLKTISALSAHSKNKQKIQPTTSKSPQIHTQPSLSKSKHKKTSLKVPLKITSLQHMADENLRKKDKSKDMAKRKHEYAGIKGLDVRKKKNCNGVEQTNAYFMKKGVRSSVKGESKSKSKDEKIRKEMKGLRVNDPTQLYFHKSQKTQGSKPKSNSKSLKKSPILSKPPTITSPPIHSRKSLFTHYF